MAEGADGTLTHPFKTLADAFTAAKTKKKRVLACGETYEEAVVLADGVTAFGNYDCSVLPWVSSALPRRHQVADEAPLRLGHEHHAADPPRRLRHHEPRLRHATRG